MTTPILALVTNGLVLEEDWLTDQSTWTSTGDFQCNYDPMRLCFGYSPIAGLQPSASGGLDSQGVRENTPFLVLGAGPTFGYTLYNYYGSSKDATTPDDPWRPQMAYSSDLLNWTRMGYVLPSNGLSNGQGGVCITRDLGYVHQSGSSYIFHSLIGAGGSGGPGNNSLIPAAPYSSDMWVFPGIPGMGSTPAWHGALAQFGAAGTFDHYSCYIGSIVGDGFGNLVCFLGTNDGTPVLNAELTISSGPLPNPISYTQTHTQLFATTPNLPENPEAYYDPWLNGYVCLTNEIYVYPYASTDSNAFRFSSSLQTWSSGINGPKWIQRISAQQGPTAIGYLRAFRMAENEVYFDANGNMPCTYDGFPISGVGANIHLGRHMLMTWLEPSPKALHYSPPGSDSGHTYRKSLTHSTVIGEMASDFTGTPGTSPNYGVDLRMLDATDFYRIEANPSGGLTLVKFVGGTPTTLQTSMGSQITYADVIQYWKWNITNSGSSVAIQAWQDGELQINYTDSSSPFTSGGTVGIYCKAADVRFRRLHMRTSDVVTVTGLPIGVPIVFRGADLIPVESGTTSSQTYSTSTIKHYPINCIEVNGVYSWLPFKAPIYGGSTINYSVPSSFTGIGCGSIGGG